MTLNSLEQYLKPADPAFNPTVHGHSVLLNMVKTYDLLSLHLDEGGQWTLSLALKTEPWAMGYGAGSVAGREVLRAIIASCWQ